MTVQEIKTQIKETRKEMKAMGIKRTSCFNGGLELNHKSAKLNGN